VWQLVLDLTFCFDEKEAATLTLPANSCEMSPSLHQSLPPLIAKYSLKASFFIHFHIRIIVDRDIIWYMESMVLASFDT